MSTKPFVIPKRLIWEAYRRVKANRGAAGVDAVSIEQFDENRNGNLYRIWNRLSSGSYFPPAVKAVPIPKKSGGERMLGVPTVSDRIAQTAVVLALEPDLERVFHPDSYGYRPGRSAHDALAREIHRLLFQSVWSTLSAFGQDPKRLGGELGMTAVLHTWGQTLTQHVHLHCLVSGGALRNDGQWAPSKGNYLFPVKALSVRFRGYMVAALRQAIDRGELSRVTHPGEVDRVLVDLMQVSWNV